MSFQDLNPVRVIKEELDANDHIIAIMGPTGAGKSSFIAAATGRDFGVGHSLQSHTSQMTAIRVKRGKNYVVLVDTPGFDDTYLSDYDILKLVSDWLRETPDSSKQSLKLCGILYLHRISDNRMGGATIKNLEMFQKLCGKDRFERVILTTTMWPEDPLDLSDAKEREKELREDYWKLMIAKGSRTEPFCGTQESAWFILDDLVKKARQAIKIQNELKKKWIDVPDTAAGKQLHGFIGTMMERQKVALRQLLEEMGKTTDQEIRDVLVKEWLSLREEQEKAERDNQRFGFRVVRMLHWSRSSRNKRATQFQYEDRCLDLISDILKNDEQCTRISRRSGVDAKIMHTFLCLVSNKEAFKEERTVSRLDELKSSLNKNGHASHDESSQVGSSESRESSAEVQYEDVYKILLDIIRNDTTTSSCEESDVQPNT